MRQLDTQIGSEGCPTQEVGTQGKMIRGGYCRFFSLQAGLFLRFQTLFFDLFRCHAFTLHPFRLGFLSGCLLCSDTLLFCLFLGSLFRFCLLFRCHTFALRLARHLFVIGFHSGGGFRTGYLRHFLNRGREGDDDHVVQGFSVPVRIGFVKQLVGDEVRLFYLAAHNQFRLHTIAACLCHLRRSLFFVAVRSVACH